MSAQPRSIWPFHPALLLGLSPLLALAYAAIDSWEFWGDALSRGQTIGRDFAIFWSAAILLWRGDVVTLFDPALFQLSLDRLMGETLAFMPFPYPPNAILVLWPLGLLPFGPALLCWLSFTFAGIAATLRRVDIGWIGILGLLFSPAAIVNICSGQNGFLSAALLGGGLLLLDKRPIAAGILIGLLSYKPQLGLLIPCLLIAGGYWRSFAVAAATVILMIVSSLLFTGILGWQLYLANSMPQHVHFLQYGSGFFQHMSPTYFMNARLFGADLSLAWTLQAVMATVIAGGAIWGFRRKAMFELKVAMALVATLLISPYVLTYDLVIAGIAILLAARCGPWHVAERGIFALAWLLPLAALLPLPSLGSVILTMLFAVLWCRLKRAANGSV